MIVFLKNKFVNKLRGFLNKHITHIDVEEFRKLLKLIIEESRLESVKLTNVIEQYIVDNVVNIYINDRNGRLEYVVSEPSYDDNIVYALSIIYLKNPNCRDILCIEKTVVDTRDKWLREIFIQQPLTIQYYYNKIASGYGLLYPLVQDPYIEEISCSSDDRYVSVIHRKHGWYGWMNTNIVVNSEAVDRIVLSLARSIGRHISIAHPVVEGLTNNGLRISATYGREVSRKGSSFVIRKKPQISFTITKLVDNGTLPAFIAAYLWLVMEYRGFIVIAGGVSSGKTTLLQALLTLIPPTRRVVTIEDTPEITTSTGYWDPLVERIISVGEGSNIDMYSLLKFSLRRRADYLVVGEVRGVEARLLIQASRLGHGVLTTIHAESPEYVIERLVSPPISIPKNLLSNIWCIVIMENTQGIRRIREIQEVDNRVKLHSVFKMIDSDKFEPMDPESLVKNTIRLTKILDQEVLINELVSRTVFINKLVSNGVFDIGSLSEELSRYYFETADRGFKT